MRITFEALKETFKRILLQADFSEDKAEVCADIFASNSRDGVYSHGLNRFPVFMEYVGLGLINPKAEAKIESRKGMMEIWNGFRGPGMYNARICMRRAVSMAKENGIGLAVIHDNNHWMRGGTYGLIAAESGCIGICFTNALASMAPWGGKEARLGNNPLVIAIPRDKGVILLDMALSQFSYGKMQEYELGHKMLPVDGGYDEQGNLIRDPALIRRNKSALPIGFWKGSGMAMVLDMVLCTLAGGLSTADITAAGKEAGLSQCFVAIQPDRFHPEYIEQIIEYSRSSTMSGSQIHFPGERMLVVREQNQREGIPVDPGIWKKVCEMRGAGSAG
jgi:3-dehydro-L-gulonate 2-dehydrogenase